MVVWTIANHKGGVGKTTTAVTLGGLLAQAGQRVLIIDTDPQASMSYYFGVDSEQLSLSLYDVFNGAKTLNKEMIMDSLCPTKLDSLYILPATMALATLDRKLGTQSGMGLILRRALDKISDEFDFVIIDCPPVLGVLMINAIAACDRVIVPVQTEFLALKGLDRIMHSLELVQKSLAKNLVFSIVPTMYDRRVKAATEAFRTLNETYESTVWKGVIPIDTKFRDASQAQSPPSVFSPKSRGVLAYTALLTYLIKLDRNNEP
ncbi:ParA family protein [Paraglaciecola aquimarina]|uniref:ParA family protein n=1 Tax=Paraglaciecola aquimarina TaxID=1235557 RepID=A0ABU3T080_9ALTE|nr:ParA family protein [Paraglaciecola aquimarina]MDU0355679.1 ParA family protein [Paraglaciecola aquimarina]